MAHVIAHLHDNLRVLVKVKVAAFSEYICLNDAHDQKNIFLGEAMCNSSGVFSDRPLAKS